MQEVAAQGSAAGEEAELRPPAFHDATMLLQDFLRLSDQFARRLGTELNVNATDYRAMEHLLRAGPLAPGELYLTMEEWQAASADRPTDGRSIGGQPSGDSRARTHSSAVSESPSPTCPASIAATTSGHGTHATRSASSVS